MSLYQIIQKSCGPINYAVYIAGGRGLTMKLTDTSPVFTVRARSAGSVA